MLTTVFNLHATPKETGRTAASVRAARESKKLENAWDSPSSREPKFEELKAKWKAPSEEYSTEELKREYAEFLEKDRGKRKGGQGLLTQTILEEEDDSEEEF
jgi:hypothetical protein